MIVQLRRYRFSEHRTLGTLTIPGQEGWGLYTLEDRIRAPGVKVPRETAIPAGRYRLDFTDSPHFGRKMLLICEVPGFVGIRIHAGRTEDHTEGCVLVSRELAAIGTLEPDPAAVAELERIVVPAIGAAGAWIEIANIAPPAFLLEAP